MRIAFSPFSLLVISLTSFLVGCSTPPENYEMAEVSEASPQTEQIAKSFEPLDNLANIYVRMNDDWYDQAATIWANGTKVGTFDEQSFINFTAAPGLYDIMVAYNNRNLTIDRDQGYLISRFDLELDPGAIVLIDCDRVDISLAGYVRTNAPVLQKVGQSCNGEFNSQQQGIGSCIAPYSQTERLDISIYGPYGYMNSNGQNIYNITDTPLGACRLLPDTQEFASMNVSQPLVSLVYSDSYAFEQALAQNTLMSFQGFVRDWPNSEHIDEANAFIVALENQQVIDAFEADIQSVLTRDSGLSVPVKRDKYMLALTGFLAEENFEETIIYFELLNRLNVEISPSFQFFWGEALIRTGKPQVGLTKLYNYIELEGQQGQYYTAALQLITETESML